MKNDDSDGEGEGGVEVVDGVNGVDEVKGGERGDLSGVDSGSAEPFLEQDPAPISISSSPDGVEVVETW